MSAAGARVEDVPHPTSDPTSTTTPPLVEPLIRATGLRKSFGDFEAVRGIDLDVPPGEAFGFLGPNGAGKSSTMRMVAAVSPPSGGELRILDGPRHPGARRSGPASGCAPRRTPSTPSSASATTSWSTAATSGCRGRSRARAPTSCSGSSSSRRRRRPKVEDLSGGMKRRLTIARSLINQPDLLLLDEPTTGLDPQARHLLWDKLFRLKQEGVTLVLTTHYMDEAEQLCDRLVVMDKGRIVAEGSPLALIREHSTREVTELRFGVGRHEDLAERVAGTSPRASRCCPTGCCSTPTTARRRWRGCTSAASTRPRCWCGGPRWRTCSCTSPAGRWWTDGGDKGSRQARPAEGLDPPARPARGSTTGAVPGRPAMVLRQVDYWATVYRRTWRGSVFTSFVTPMFYVLAMGVLLGEFIDDGSADLQGAPTYLAFIAPGLVAAHAMMIAVGEVTWPVLGAIKWNRTYLGMVATPLSVADVVAAHFAFVLFRVATTCGAFLLVLALFGVFASFWGAVAAFAVQLLIGMAFAAPIYGFSAGLKDQTAFALIYRVGVMPLFLFSGAFFPVSNLPDGCEWLARRDAAVARGRPDPDAHPGRRRRRARAGPPRLPDRRCSRWAGGGRCAG